VKEISIITPHHEHIDGPTSGNYSSFVTPIEQTQSLFVDDTLSTAPTVTPFAEAPSTTLPPIMSATTFQSPGHINAVTSSAALAGRKPTATFGQSTFRDHRALEHNLHSSNTAEAHPMTLPPAALSGANAVDPLLSEEERALVLRMQNESCSFDTIVTALRVAREVRRQDNIDLVQTTEQPPEYSLRES